MPDAGHCQDMGNVSLRVRVPDWSADVHDALSLAGDLSPVSKDTNAEGKGLKLQYLSSRHGQGSVSQA